MNLSSIGKDPRPRRIAALAITALLLASTAMAAEQDLKLWYTKPATKWNDALPLGNGRLGAMVFGGVAGRASSAQRGHARFRLSRLPRPAAGRPQGFLHGHRSDRPSPVRRGRQARDPETGWAAPGPAISRWATCSSTSTTRGRRKITSANWTSPARCAACAIRPTA